MFLTFPTIHHIPLLFLGKCEGEVVPPPFVVTTVFSDSF